MIATSPAYHDYPPQRLLQNFPDTTLNGLNVEIETMEPRPPRNRGGMSVAPRIVSRELAFVED